MMDESKFQKYQESFRHLMAEKSPLEVRACLDTFQKLQVMSDNQRERLISDLKLLEHYKTRTLSASGEFEKIMEGFYRA